MKITKKVLILALLVATLATANPAYAASAGRISGGSFRSSSSRSYSGGRPSRSYSAPRMYDGPSNRFSTNIIVLPDLAPNVTPPVHQGSRVASASEDYVPLNPQRFFILLGVLGVAGVTLFLLIGGWDDFVAPWLDSQREKSRKVTIVRQRVALLTSAKDVQSDLIHLAERGNTGSSRGLAKILQETTLALLRHPDKVVFAWSDKHKASLEKASDMFNQLSIQERSKVSEEVLTNIDGKVSSSVRPKVAKNQGSEYILVNILVASDKDLELKISNSAESLRTNLVALGSMSPKDLLALEIIWQPEDGNDALSQEELLSLYPYLNRI